MPLSSAADPLDASARRLGVDAGRHAAPPRRALRADALRRLALEVAVRLDAHGLHSDAQAIFDESARRDRSAPGALTDGPFEAWLRAIEGRLDVEMRSAVAA